MTNKFLLKNLNKNQNETFQNAPWLKQLSMVS